MALSIRSIPRFLLVGALSGLCMSALGCGNGSSAPSTLNATWVLTAATDADPLTAKTHPCADFGATTVRIQVTPGDSYDFSCDDGHGDTKSFEAGYYGVQVILFGSFGKVLDAIEFQQTYAFGPTKLGDPLRFRIR